MFFGVGLGVVWVFFGGCFGSPSGGLTLHRREAGYSHFGDQSESAGRPDIRTKTLFCVCVCVFLGSLVRPRVRVFGQHSGVMYRAFISKCVRGAPVIRFRF